MKRLLPLLLLFAITAAAQTTVVGGGSSVVKFAGAPSGACVADTTAVDTTTGNFYSCNNSVWLLVGPGAAGSAAFNTLTAGTNAGQALVVGNGSTLGTSGTGTITATSAAKWVTPRNLAGNSVDGSANVAFANKFVVQGTADTGLSGAQFLGSLATGIVKNTTTTGVLSIAAAGDFPTLNQNTTGSAAKWTTARSLAGNSVDGSGDVAFANKVIAQGTADAGLSGAQFLGALATGLVKNTTTTGVLSIAASSDILGLWTGTKSSAFCMAGDGTMQSCAGGTATPGGVSGDVQCNNGSGGFAACTTVTVGSGTDGGVELPNNTTQTVSGATNARIEANGNKLKVSENGAAFVEVAKINSNITGTAAGLSGHPTVEGVTSTGATGTGKFVFDGSPTLVTPVLGVATATSINGTSIPTSKTLMATDTSVLAAQMPALTGDVTTSAGAVATSFRTGINVRVCELIIWGTGASNVLQDTDDWASDCKNAFGVTWTITGVQCYADAGSPTFMLTVNGGSNVLSGNLTCGTATWAAGTLSGTPTVASAGSLDFSVIAAGGTAHYIRVLVYGTI